MTVATPAGGGGSTGATTPFFLGEDDVPNSKTLVAASVSVGVIPLAASATSTGAATSLTIVGNDKGETILIDVKTMGKISDGVYRNKRVRTAKQKELGVKLLAFNPVTRKLTFIESKGDRQRELF